MDLQLKRKQKKVWYIYSPHTNEDIERAYDVGQFPTRPSDVFLKVYSDVLHTVENNPRECIAAPEYLATHGAIPLSINAHAETLFSYYRDCIVNAKSEILIAAGFWRSGKVNKIISGALLELNDKIASEGGGRKVVVKMLWGRGKILYHKKRNRENLGKLDIPNQKQAPYLEIECMNCHKPIFGVFHTKFMIVDHQILLLTSANMQDKPQNIEYMIHMEGKIVDSFYDTYLHMWRKSFVPPPPFLNTRAPARSDHDFSQGIVRAPCIFHSTLPSAVPMFLAHRRPGNWLGHRKWVTPQNVAWLSAMHHAQHKLFIETPDFNEKLAIHGVLEACRRNVQVTIVVSWVYNQLKEQVALQGGSNKHVMKKLYKKLDKIGKMNTLTVCFYVADTQTNPTKTHANHTKFMAIDDTFAIVGSGNMDTQSWQHSQEVNVVIDSPSYVAESMDLFRISQSTHLYGVINPLLPTHPVQQIRQLLAKSNTVPKPVNPNPPGLAAQ